MVAWTVLLLFFCLLIVVWSIVQKLYNEHKIKNGRRNLAGKVVVITGASSGIGEALAHEFYSLGCRVVLCARRAGELERVRRNLLNTKLVNGIQSIRPEIVTLDLNELNQLPDKAHHILRSCLHVDILINNGGISLRSDVMSVQKEVDTRLMNVNYLGTITLTKALLPAMIERKLGTVVFVSSVVGRLPIPYRSAYTASKHALQAFADCLRAEIAAHNIRVLVSSPGYVATEVSRNALTGYGTLHGVMDPETAAGQKPDEYAYEMLRAILREDQEIIPMKFIPVIWLRAICPSIYFQAMKQRAQKLAARHNVTQIV